MACRRVSAQVVLACLVLGCPSRQPPAVPHDAATDHPTDAPVARSRRHRRNRRTPRIALNGTQGAHTLDPNAPNAQGTDDSSDEGPPAARPRITETGPMLPDDLGPPPAVAYDMGSAHEGPMGLSTEQVSEGLNPLLPRFTTCAAATTDDQGHGPHGRVNVRLRVHNDGRPVAARVSGGGGPAEFIPCVRRVVAAARFAHFGGPDVMVGWGFDVD